MDMQLLNIGEHFFDFTVKSDYAKIICEVPFFKICIKYDELEINVRNLNSK